mmetsp:Transcript_5487/g.8501  ORF Transcript_5487/g.8501 Transcript_5487/m.8501 type:complete len:174 (-) Transcript_5487:57-578(-)
MLLTGRVEDPFQGNEHTRRGERLEPIALQWYKDNMLADSSIEVRTTGFWMHPKYNFLGASPDGLVGCEGLIEIKCPARSPHSTVPAEYMAQIQGQLHIIDRKWCDFVSFTVTNGVRVFRVYKSDEFWKWIFPRLSSLYCHVEFDEEPQNPPGSEREARKTHALSLCRVEQLLQ